ncbi:MAG: hypothetical protein EKK31_11880 [Hyphomicrobiales bacterium]|nr:MAG: hypothetical protein EKK31_11880 [Hyphomicrobiales bacterium]
MGFVTEEQAAAIFAAIDRRDAEREAEMPDTRAALYHASVGQDRLMKLGWADGIYCPKDGTRFALVQWGSTGVHAGFYMGNWPDGHIYCGDFLVQPQAVMWKAIDKLSPDETAMLAASEADDRAFMNRQLAAFAEEIG